MKEIFTNIVVTLLLLIISSPIEIRSQDLIKVGEDTKVVISIDDVKTINKVFVDHKLLNKKVESLENIIFLDSVTISKKDSVIECQESLMKYNKAIYESKISWLEKENKSEKRKRLKTNTILGSVIVAIIGGFIVFK